MSELPISRDLLEILRDPLAVQEPEKYGPDPGQLELVGEHWLVSKDTGLKYPIRDGIPVMLIDEGMRWKDTAVADLPIPPPEDKPAPNLAPVGESPTPGSYPKPNMTTIGAAVAGVVGLLLLLRRVFSRNGDKE